MRREIFKLFCALSIIVLLSSTLSCSRQAEEPQGFRPPTFSGVAFVQVSEGDHISVLNLANGELARIKTNINGKSLLLKKPENKLFIFSNDGKVKTVDISTGDQSPPRRITSASCGASILSSGEILVTDTSKGVVLRYIPSDGEISRLMPIQKGECYISTTRREDGTHIVLSNEKAQSLRIIRLEDLTIIKKLEGVGNSIHQAVYDPSGSGIWVSEGNEFKNGKPYGVGFAKTEAAPGGVNIINPTSGAMEDHIIVGGNLIQIIFSEDGRYAYTISSQMPEYDEATLTVIDVNSRRVIKNYALCKSCHIWKGVELPEGKAFVSSFAIDEGGKPDEVSKVVEEPFFSSQKTGDSIINPKTVD